MRIFNYLVDDDYVNKQFVCPTCGQKDVLYIDLNDIRSDPQKGSGTVVRSFSHQDHLLLLDIDYHGDIRTITPIDAMKKLENHQSKYEKVNEIVQEYCQTLILSNDHNIELLFKIGIDNKFEEISRLNLISHPKLTDLSLDDIRMYWIMEEKLDDIPKQTQWDLLIIDNTIPKLVSHPIMVDIFNNAKRVICLDEELSEALATRFPDKEIELIQ